LVPTTKAPLRRSPVSTLSFDALFGDDSDGEDDEASPDGTASGSKAPAPPTLLHATRVRAAVQPAAAAAYARQLAAPSGALERKVAVATAAFLDSPAATAAVSAPDDGAEVTRLLAAALRAAGFSAVAVVAENAAAGGGATERAAGSPTADARTSLLQRSARHAFVAVDAGAGTRLRLTPSHGPRVHARRQTASTHTLSSHPPTHARPPLSLHSGASARFSEVLIVEPRLREQFELPRPDGVYAAVLAALPETYVGSEARLAALVKWMAARMRDAFTSANMTTPPWRAEAPLLAKWRLHERADAADDVQLLQAVLPYAGGRPTQAVHMVQRNGVPFVAHVAACTPTHVGG
jgi:uncharacterized protein (TIGR01615 family)